MLGRGKTYLLATARPDGYLSFNAMYEHGLATLALAELYGMDPDPKLETKKASKQADADLKNSQAHS